VRILRHFRAAALCFLLFVLVPLWTGCGDVYRPVATPITPNPPSPNFNHFVIAVSTDGPNSFGATTDIDVSGDTNLGVAQVGIAPVHAAMLPGAFRIFVADSGDSTVASFAPTTISPIVFTTLPAGSIPVFIATAETANVYVADDGNNSVLVISVVNGIVTNQISVGMKPVAMVETPDTEKIYVASAGNSSTPGSVTSINASDKTANPPVGSGWVSPVWVASRSDSQRVYVLDSGTGTVTAIDTFADGIIGSASVGVGANYMFYDSKLNRLNVTNPAADTMTILDASQDSLPALATISFAAGSVPCPAGCAPLSITALPDGSKAYVATAAVSGTTVTSRVTVINELNNTIKGTVALTSVPLACTTNSPYELFTAASADSSRVYVSNCDAGSIGIISTIADSSPGDNFGPDTLITNMPAPLGTGPITSPGGTPAPQNPVFILPSP